MEKFKRHFGALMRKNLLLKRRHPCSLFCELFLAVSVTALLVFARSLVDVNAAVRNLETQMLLERSMPVRLPECATYYVDCNAELVEGEPHSPMCIKGATYGCKSNNHGEKDPPGVWVSMGCNGTFDVGPGFRKIHCKSGPMGKLRICHAQVSGDANRTVAPLAETDGGHSRDRADPARELRGGWPNFGRKKDKDKKHEKKGEGGGGVNMMQGLLSTPGTIGMHRLSAIFAVVGTGGHKFRSWLRKTSHPWARSVKLFKNAEALQAHLSDDSYPVSDIKKNKTTSLCAAVVFETPPESDEVRYTLRFNTTLSPDPSLPPIAGLMRATRIKTDDLESTTKQTLPGSYDLSGITWYTQSGFLAMQRTVDTYLEHVAMSEREGRQLGTSKKPQVGGSALLGEDWRPHIVAPFPVPGRNQDIFAMLMPNLLAPFLLISLAYSVNRMITAVVYEREARLRDGMRMMGMHQAAFYMSWIFTYVMMYLFVCTAMTFCLTMGKILPNSSPSLIFVWLFLFSTASISYGLFITAFFSKAKTAATVGSVAFYASSYLQFLATPSSSPACIRTLQLCPPVCFNMIAKAIANIESQSIGITWSNAGEPFQKVSVLGGCGMLAFDTVALFVLFLYLDQVVPHDIGVRRPWYFPVMPSFWREVCIGSKGIESDSVQRRDSERDEPESCALVEREIGEAAAMMARSNQTVELRSLCKVFGELRAVRNLNLVMYQGEIFALLGHNGAGKTTTLGMLCGLMPPTRGSCVVFGHDLASERGEVQKLLGVCPQHDVLWGELTGLEHLTLFAGFKGVQRENAAIEVSSMLQRVGLQGAVNTQAARLSGGMKRKLSLGIAFLGGSRLVVLDEPTSGLDPYSRRMVWELLRAMKQGRVTVLSTHYMDEADILGDRIAILHEGSLRCCGTPQFLKRAYDCGYNVTFVKRAGCDTEAVREALICNMPELASEVVTLSDSGNELMIQFPFAAARHFPQVLGGLEQNMADLCVESYGISVTTLEEVFLKVASGEKMERPSSSSVQQIAESEVSDSEYVELNEVAPASMNDVAGSIVSRSGSIGDDYTKKKTLVGCARFVIHTKALLTKRFRYGMRDRRGLICQLCLPTGTLLMLLAIISHAFFHSMPALELNASHYNRHCDSDFHNTVDFSHLPSVNATSAKTVVEPGCRFWSGDSRYQPPHQGLKHDIVLEESLTSTIPGLARVFRPAVAKALKQQPRLKEDVKKVLKQHPDIEAQVEGLEKGLEKGRRLASSTVDEHAALAIMERQAWDVVTGLWTSSNRARSEAERWFDAPAEYGAASLDAEVAAFADHAKRRLVESERSPQEEKLHDLEKRELQNWDKLKDNLPQQLKQLETSPELRLKLPGLEEQLKELLPDRLQKKMPQIKERIEKGMEEQLPNFEKKLQKQLPKLGHNLSVMLGVPDLGIHGFDDLEALQEFQHLKGMDIGKELMEPFKDEPTWKVCAEQPSLLKVFWITADKTMQGFLTKRDLTIALDHFVQGYVKQPVNRGAEVLLTEVLFALIDQNHDGKISHREFCLFGAAMEREVEHYHDVATHFSKQLLKSPTPCTRYGAYFLLRGPRNASSPKWQTGADAVLFVNTSSSHAAPAFQAAFTNARFSRLGLNKVVNVKTHPFQQTQSEQMNLERIAVFFLSMYITFSLSFIPSGIAHFIVKERETGAKQLQVLSGVSTGCYWLSNLIADNLLYVVPAVSIPFALKASGFSMILQGDCGQALVAVVVALGPALAGFTYIVSFLFKDHSKAANMILTFCLVGASVLSTISFILSAINYNPMSEYPSECDHPTEEFPDGNCASPEARQAHKILGPLFRLVPTVCVYEALFSIALVANLRLVVPKDAVNAMLSAAGVHAPHLSFSPWAWEWAGTPLLYLCVEAVAYSVIVIMLDTCLSSPRLSRYLDAAACLRRMKGLSARRSRDMRSSPLTDAVLGENQDGAEDDSVEAERERVSFLEVEQVALHVSRLEKTYRRWLALHAPAKHAVRGVSLAVHTGEVFGFLGHNGAGKTSAIKCIIGEQSCTAGAIHAGGYDMERQVASARRQVGYCPQFDALMELLTVRDHLEFYAALKGLPAAAVAQAQKDFGLERNAHRRADVLSGGNKRKLSAAIALLGRPTLAVLDEPSCGLDPAARRALWDAVHCAVAGSKLLGEKPSAVLLTTHSMEEAEALSTRLGILAEGKLLTVGTSQQIKQRHGSCHELCLTLAAESAELLSSTLNHLGGGQLRPDTPLDVRSVGPLLDADATKKRAYARPRCVVRAQIEAVGHVEAAVLAEWWLQQGRGEAVENFLKALLGDAVELAENFGPYWRFRLPHSSSLGLPGIFGQLEEHGKALGIAEYTLTQATLEQIFNSMAQDADAERLASLAV